MAVSTNPSSRNRVAYVAAAMSFAGFLVLVAVLSFLQGKASAQRRVEIQLANDDAFFCLYALKALKEPEKEKWKTLFGVGLDGAALKLSEMSIRHPELIANTNYNLMIQIQDYLMEHRHPPDRSPALKPVDEVLAKIAEASAKLHSVHPDPRKWEEEESGHAR